MTNSWSALVAATDGVRGGRNRVSARAQNVPRWSTLDIRSRPLHQKTRDKLAAIVPGRRKPQQWDLLYQELSLGVALYYAATAAGKLLRRGAVTRRLKKLRQRCESVMREVAGLDGHIGGLISTWSPPYFDPNSGDEIKKAYRTASSREVLLSLCGFINVLSDVLAFVQTWPVGSNPDWGRRFLAYHVAKGLKEVMGIKPTNTRSGVYHQALDAVLSEVGIQRKGKGRDLAPLARAGIQMLQSASSTEFSVV